ncbi:ribose-phosphate pyrophosphokinase 1 [Histoplasma capsulatum G186AR]|uniref:Ribose-phosphate pyrophosphokinase 1 n=2 Tax=Ajellomyces capsulatus TaxID=5037 RepID=C0NDH6_AJECG|nr:ribose-phosphate pyrophosphokinase 1 [Histoplasma capsulatum G186AR]EEH11717.1 ribose-phosphate pyrophosphokinase 1 [Histoplasma capsulatum G186AR]KAG5302427.1 ribose-phosphate pyrophosphokinase 1 [Histoplasma capsulatum]QSS72174.1 ribose-phosphate pyrophosphokinase 1 [Histoplasma capsulatum G186AR]
MRGVQIFSGSSHPTLTEAICERLGTLPAKCELRKFSNGETSVNIGVSVRNQDVFIVQSGSSKINDSVMELLIMISACKGGSAKSITAVMPYFPYSRQSKKKSHRGAITARMLANLLTVAGVDHIITVDLHASQMQGFFGRPVDNLFAEPLIARWIRMNVPRWNEAVVVTKNAGGSKRVTSLADALKLNFGIVNTDRSRGNTNSGLSGSAIFFDSVDRGLPSPLDEQAPVDPIPQTEPPASQPPSTRVPVRPSQRNVSPSPLARTASAAESESPPSPPHASATASQQIESSFSARRPSEQEAAFEYTDERAREVITGRLVQGHIVDDDYSSPILSSTSVNTISGDRNGTEYEPPSRDPMTLSFISNASSFHPDHALGGSFDAAASSDEEDNKQEMFTRERTVTLVGDVRDKKVFIVDDMIDKPGSWIAAAETVVKRGGAKKVYCIATHGLFNHDSLQEMEACRCIDYIVITNSFPIPPNAKELKKLIVIDLSALLSESIRRHHYGESISALFQSND